MEEPKKKKHTHTHTYQRSGWIPDTAFDEINLLSDAIKYLSIQYHPSSSTLSFFFFFFYLSLPFFYLSVLFLFFCFSFLEGWRGESRLLGSLVCNLEWCMGGYCRECKLKTNIHPSSTTGGPARQLEVSKRRKSSILSREYIFDISVYRCLGDLSSLPAVNTC